MLACPVCAGRLQLDGNSLLCANQHRHDIARQGHVNLLGRAAPKNADTAEMLAARDRFLSAGHYRPIEQALARRVGRPRRLLEVGAGTGHYLARVLESLDQAGADAVALATDVSPQAARRCARAHPRMAAVVADTWAGLPVRSGLVDALLCVFAPRNPDEFARVCAPGATLLVVTPNPAHLAGAREALGLIQVEADKLGRLNRSLSGRFEGVWSQRIRWEMELDAAALADLVAMGPNAFHEHRAVETAMLVEADVQLSVFRRPAGQG